MTPPLMEVQAVAGTQMQPASDAAAVAPSGRFAQWFTGEVEQLNTQLVNAEQGLQQLATGTAPSLHEVMIRMEEARLSFQLATQFRNRVLEAYQEVMRMQV